MPFSMSSKFTSFPIFKPVIISFVSLSTDSTVVEWILNNGKENHHNIKHKDEEEEVRQEGPCMF